MKRYEDLTLTDDFMFSKVMQDEELCKELVEILLDVKIDKIEYLSNQKSINEDFLSRGIRLDVYLKDSQRVFDIEIQTTNNGNLLKRARYYQAMIDIDTLRKSENYNELKESFVVFICTFDPFNKRGYKYTFKNTCLEYQDLENNDKTYKVFYNVNAFGQSKNKNVQTFLKYLATQNANSDFTRKLEKAVFTAKGNESWRVNYMTLGMKYDEFLQRGLEEGRTKGLEEGREQGREQGRIEGRDETKLETAKIALKNNLPMEMIVKLTGLSVEQIQKIELCH